MKATWLASALLLTVPLTAHADSTRDLLRLTRARLDLARTVALAKLYWRGPIEDRVRERAVINSVRLAAPKWGVDPGVAERYFFAQIEASKTAQRAWQSQWAREGAPFDPRPDLRNVRPQLDRLTDDILRTLATHPKPASPKLLQSFAPVQPWLRPAWTEATRELIPAPRSG